MHLNTRTEKIVDGYSPTVAEVLIQNLAAVAQTESSHRHGLELNCVGSPVPDIRCGRAVEIDGTSDCRTGIGIETVPIGFVVEPFVVLFGVTGSDT
jgi:hypothetical protein